MNVLLVSGGLDSYGMYKWLTDSADFGDYRLLHFDLGQPYAEKEKKIVQELYPEHHLHFIKIDGWLEKGSITKENYTIPARNLVMLSMAVNYGTDIYMAGIQDENHKYMLDKNSYIFSKFSHILSKITGQSIVVTSPFFNLGWNKVEIIQYLLSNKDIQFFKTTSCYSETSHRCGECLVCLKRWLAEEYVKFHSNLPDTFFPPFDTDPFSANKDMLHKFLNSYFDAFVNKDFGHYHENRITRDSLTFAKIIMERSK